MSFCDTQIDLKNKSLIAHEWSDEFDKTGDQNIFYFNETLYKLYLK